MIYPVYEEISYLEQKVKVNESKLVIENNSNLEIQVLMDITFNGKINDVVEVLYMVVRNDLILV